MSVIDVRARSKDPIAFDLLAYFYLAAFDGALNLYDQRVLDELSDKLKSAAKANEGYVKYGGVDRNFADYAFHMIMTDVNDQVEEEMDALVRQGVTSFKLFMAYPGVFMLDDGSIFKALLRTGKNGGTICTPDRFGGGPTFTTRAP